MEEGFVSFDKLKTVGRGIKYEEGVEGWIVGIWGSRWIGGDGDTSKGTHVTGKRGRFEDPGALA